MSFTKHIEERAAKNVIKQQCFRIWLVWTSTLMLVFSGLTIPLLGLLTSPFVFGFACLLLLAPAACRAKSLTEPILYPATVLMPTHASLLGLGPESKPARFFYTVSLPLRFLAGASLMAFPYWNSFVEDVEGPVSGGIRAIQQQLSGETKDETFRCCRQTYLDAKTACEHVLSAHRSCYEGGYWILNDYYVTHDVYLYGYGEANNTYTPDDYRNINRCNQLFEDPTCTKQLSQILRHLVHNDSDFDWIGHCNFESLKFPYYIMLEHWVRLLEPGHGCYQPKPMVDCLKDFRQNHYEMRWTMAPACQVVTDDAMTRFCSIMSQLPPYLLCELADSKLADFEPVGWSWHWAGRLSDFYGCLQSSQLLRASQCLNVPKFRESSKFLGDVGAIVFEIVGYTVSLSPALAVVLLMISCCVSRTRNDVDVAVRVAVDDEVQRLQEELEKNKTAQLSTFAYVLLRVDLVLVSMDMFGDILAVFTWISTGHVWFGIFQILVILRSVPGIVLLQREQGLVKEVRDSLKANTLTDGLYNLMLQEKTIEGVLTSLLLAYGLMHTFDSQLAFYVTTAKWALSLRSVTNGCFIQFHLAPGDAQTRLFLATLPAWPLGRRYHLDTE
ncbi:unnamed protein product [Durusdinium trenchii]|uniref:Uncharacterized protein n=1 Tax=Durusdinium trenchii TaxID=1381693 RepID=A0ABP0RET5_9DINO